MSMPPSLPEEVFDELLTLMHAFRRRWLAEAQHVWPGLTFGELRVLALVGRTPGLTQKALVTRSHADKALIARTVAQLEARGWLVQSTLPQDRRSRCLHLSAHGQAVVERLQAQRAQLSDELLQGLTARQQRTLLTLLQSMHPMEAALNRVPLRPAA